VGGPAVDVDPTGTRGSGPYQYSDATMQPRLTDDSGTTVGPGIEGIERRFPHQDFDPAELEAAKAGRRISVCIPARNEAGTVGAVVDPVITALTRRRGGIPLVDEVLVVDDGSTDATASRAREAGARVVTTGSGTGVGGGGKGQAMRLALEVAEGDLIAFVDADVTNFGPHFVSGLLGPLVLDATTTLVKGYYRRPLHDAPEGGGRVTELVAKPLIDLLFPALDGIVQPLAGESAAPRSVLEACGLADGYAVELALLIDVASRFGAGTIAQVDLGTRVHRNRPLAELRPQATEILRMALARANLDRSERSTTEG
jgi:glucosyl-3-phosphoglycerate synthase